MQVQTYSEILSQFQPRYRLAPRGQAKLFYDGEDRFYWQDCEWVLTEESLQEGIEIAQRALEADKIWQDAHRQVATAVAKCQILASIPKVLKNKHIALTICPKDANPELLLQIADIVSTAKCVHAGKFVIEQRSVPGEQPYGWHMHLYIETDKAPSTVKQKVQKMLDTRKIQATYWATPANENWLKNYMQGTKGDPEKDLKVKQDRILRSQMGLQDIYDIPTKSLTT